MKGKSSQDFFFISSFIFILLAQANVEDCARLHEVAEQLEQFITDDENRQAEAERTHKFWCDCPTKVSVSTTI